MNYQKKIIKIAMFVFAVAMSTSGFAQSRAKSKFGLGVGILSDPAPSLLSYQVKFNVTKWLQIHGGYGSIKATASSVDPTTGLVSTAGGSVTTYGAGAKLFLMSNWNFSPYAGGGYSFVKASGDFSISGTSIASDSGKMQVAYGSVGIDHQANIGFNFGVGANFFLSPTNLKTSLKYLAHGYVGWFF